ncbi:hypothetical protein FCM35_KLT16825 [Carex littledalei]|uniref:Uncharacterized protein n=1 Tax=Carex littledalei TaxID=544730 RepID=A0A833RDL3_9POAL|nr:hypothetical protein FCM35_KLT08621 [Carex littledalei]KAF3339354.1 hypothetical protein FCM35_KLT16825 [Carex littledalei]
MAWLKSHENIRRVLMRLCNHLSKRYAKYLEMARTKRKEISEEDPEGQIDPGQIAFCWDDFGDPEVKKVLDEVSQDAKKGGPPGSTSEKDKKNGDADAVCTRDRRKENFERRFGDILNSRGEVIRKTVQESLAVANAVKILKLVFLSTARSENVQASVVVTLQLYSESDIFTALTYLRDKNYMVGGFNLSDLSYNTCLRYHRAHI